jgi:NADH:ubiquinone oxidoreductase subunit H
LLFILIFLVFLIPILLSVAYYTLAERKIMASVQRRKGPNVVGFFGLLQPLADGLKLIFKEPIIPRKANFLLFIFAPVLTFSLSLLLWLLVPFSIFEGWLDSNFGLLYLFAISSLSIFGIIGAG